MPNVRMVLLKQIEQLGSGQGAFVFFTNYDSVKGGELASAGKAAFVLHSKTQQRQMRVRGLVSREDGSAADDYFASRSLKSRLGAWASKQSQPLDSRASLLADVARVTAQYGTNPPRPPFWGGFRITPLEIEFWADGAFRLHDRFRWSRATPAAEWQIRRLNP